MVLRAALDDRSRNWDLVRLEERPRFTPTGGGCKAGVASEVRADCFGTAEATAAVSTFRVRERPRLEVVSLA